MKSKLDFTTVKFWQEEIKSCLDRQKKELIKRNCYPLLINYYEGEQSDTKKYDSNNYRQCVINEYFPNTNALISEISYRNPDLILEATKPDAEENINIMKSALGYGFKKLDALTENKLALFDMIMAGYSAVEVNHINLKDTDMLNTADMKSNTREQNIIKKGINAIKKVFNNKDEVEEELTKELPLKEESYATEDKTYLRRWNPLDILLDWRAERIKDLRYIVKRLRWSYAEFAARYPELKDKITKGQRFDFSFHKNEEDSNFIELYDIQVKKAGNKYVNIVISLDYNLAEIDYYERPYTTNGFNVKIGTLHKYGKLYPISFAKINKDIQDDINNYATHIMEVAERSIPKYGIDKEKVTAAGKRALRSNNINDLVETEGPPTNSITPLQHTKVSVENKEYLGMIQQHKEKLWNVSESRLLGRSQSEFATEMQIQEAGFTSRQIDLQEGLRNFIIQELDTLKDIIVQFWDGEYFFKITGGEKPEWYIPRISVDPITGQQIIQNSLAEILTMDYEIDVDISSALIPNKEKKKKDLIEFAQWIISPEVLQFLQSKGQTINVDVIKKVANEWGWNADNLIMPLPEENVMPPGAGQQLPPEMPVEGVM